MDLLVIIILGLISGLLYVGNIYVHSRQGKNPILTFPLRFLMVILIMFFVKEHFETRGIIVFVISHTIGIFLFTAYKVFKEP